MVYSKIKAYWLTGLQEQKYVMPISSLPFLLCLCCSVW